MTPLSATGDPAGAIVAVGLLIIGLVGIPEARLFFLFTGIWGGLLGLYSLVALTSRNEPS